MHLARRDARQGHRSPELSGRNDPGAFRVDLLWIPLGAGTPIVGASGKIYEALAAARERRARCDLYHSALDVVAPSGRFVIEVTPVVDAHGSTRGVVGGGPVGLRALGRFRLFRYEIRCWQDGGIPDARYAVAGPRRVTEDAAHAQRVIDLAPTAPRLVWGRDELRLGEMWNSNSLTSWLLARAGVDVEQIALPAHGRAPGWDAGIAYARGSGGRRRAMA